jgi:hypothetical protein
LGGGGGGGGCKIDAKQAKQQKIKHIVVPERKTFALYLTNGFSRKLSSTF